MKFFVFNTILILGYFTLANGQENCGSQEVQLCTKDKFVEFKFPESLFMTEEQLNEFCPIILNIAQCLKSYIERCPSSSPFGDSTFDDLFGRIHGVITLICTERSAYRNEYLENSPCLLENIQTLVNCTLPEEHVEDLIADTAAHDKTSGCIQMTRAQSCIMKSARNVCGREAGNIVRYLLFAAAPDIIVTCFTLP